MFIDLSCGKCDQSLSVESEDNDALWSLIHRFANGHSACGFIAPVGKDDIPVEEVKRKMVQPRKFAEDD